MSFNFTKDGVSLNDGVDYFTYDDFDLGEPSVTETWIEPKISGAVPQLANLVGHRAVMTIPILVDGSSAADLGVLVRAVRNAFATDGDLVFTRGSVVETFKVYRTILPPAIAGQEHGAMHTHQGMFMVRRWELKIPRQLPYSGGGSAVVI
ncbi:MAG: hypothetical protein WD556_11410 [Actinomycetota bacterium]